MIAEPISVVFNWLALSAHERAQLGLDQAFGQVRLDYLDDIGEEAERRSREPWPLHVRIDGMSAGPFWAHVAQVAELVSLTRLTAAGYLPREMTADFPAQDIIQADRAYLAAEGLLPG